MSKPDPDKQARILDAAAELFTARPFHEVRLDDIAAQAQVGKGTVYLYWSSKEDVYLAIIRRGFAAVLARLDQELPASQTPWDAANSIVSGLVDFAFDHPGVYRIMRSGSLTPEDPELQRLRRAVADRIEATIRSGVAAKVMSDPSPALTTQYVLSFIRGVMLYPPPGLTRDALKEHLMRFLRHGLGAPA